jgi:hypothetical protein
MTLPDQLTPNISMVVIDVGGGLDPHPVEDVCVPRLTRVSGGLAETQLF